jgi:nucleoside-diphosphate kinase
MERTLFIVKPNATHRNLVGAVLKILEEGGLRIAALRMLSLSKEEAERFYDVHRERPFFASLVEFMCSGPVVPGIAEGPNAVERLRAVMGATDPAKAEAGTVRALYGENIQNNAIHGSDSAENAVREIEFFFPGLSKV